jgi:hypothetical protein
MKKQQGTQAASSRSLGRTRAVGIGFDMNNVVRVAALDPQLQGFGIRTLPPLDTFITTNTRNK